MNRFAKVLFSVLLVSLSFSGHSFQASDEAINPYQLAVSVWRSNNSANKNKKYDKSNESKQNNKAGQNTCAIKNGQNERDFLANLTHNDIKYVYNSIKDAPCYPKGFRAVQDGTTKNVITNKFALHNLRKLYPGKWSKVYMNGFDTSGRHISIHFFRHQSGKVFNVKIKYYWS
ncbi:hypothetical protein PSI23_21260 [Xenorhabdus sp. XENO-10]|uniref:Uncharacterized protein n=1 Tax=Xenorhabdus yunnanensis TaxID=3025878 RepID=A0ABT5LKV6_9GAMM|nr:hypothetical protein [Xenorhabdus yunnanensis]MDC9591739.1 hypothetical protein [Xenorhabdus yunnanensis]